MKKVFISQAMNGKTDEEIKQKRDYMIQYAKKYFGDDVYIIPSYISEHKPDTNNIALKYVSESLKLLSDADVAIFERNFEFSRGCVVEYFAAKQYGIETIVIL